MSGDAPAAGAAPAAAPAAVVDTSAPAPAAAADPTGPRTSSDIAANVIERAANPTQEDDPDDGLPTPGDAAAAERFSEEEKLLREYGFKRAKKADGSEHTIPRTKVLSMIASGLKRGSDRWNAEKAALEQEAQGLRSFRDGFAESLRGPEDQFLAYISQHDPRYRRYLEQQAAAPAAPAAPKDTGEPQPDLDMGNGNWTFSKQGLQKWLDWSVEQRLAPINQEREAAKRQQAVEQQQQEMRGRVRDQIGAAQQWPSWGDYENDVLKKLQDDTAQAKSRGQRPQMSLREAYLEVKAERLEAASDPAKVRDKVMADINAAPRSTALRTGAEVPRVAGARSTSDIARATLERLERGGR